MGGLDFKAPVPKDDEDEKTIAHNTRVGLVLFFVYVAFYACFMALSAFWPMVMSMPLLCGVSLSVVFGFALIIVAIALALLYMKLSRRDSKEGSP